MAVIRQCQLAARPSWPCGPHHRRYAGYDYSRGASLFITVATEPRRLVFGSVEQGGAMALAPYGAIVEASLKEAGEHFGGISLVKHVVMPDHVHFRLVVAPGQPNPIRLIGSFVGRFKQLSQWRISKVGGPRLIWEKGYHDHLCLSREMNEAVDHYIENNPLKWWLMHSDGTLMQVREPLDTPWLPSDVFWRGAGNVEIGRGQKLVSLRISRKVAQSQLEHVADICARGAEKGYIYISTFFSPGEHAAYRAVAERTQAPMVNLRADAVSWGYRPRGMETTLFGAGRLMVVARMEATDDPARRPDLLWLNEIARRAALAQGGKAVYVTADATGKPVFSVQGPRA